MTRHLVDADSNEIGVNADAGDKYYFEENTVIRLSEQLRRTNHRIYLGIMFYDMPDDIQDSFVVEVSDVIQNGRRTKTVFSSDTVKIGIQVKPTAALLASLATAT